MGCRRLAACLAFFIVLGCRDDPRPVVLPPGFVVDAPAREVRTILERWRTMQGTPLADAASAALQRVAPCSVVSGHGESLVQLAEALQCSTSTTTNLWALPQIGSQRFRGQGFLVEDGVVLRGELGTFDRTGPRLADDPPTQSVLRALRRIAWIHVRLDDLDVQRLVEREHDAADGLFAVKAATMLNGVLTGEVEGGLYPPTGAGTFPTSIVAIGLRSATVGNAALNALVERLETLWSTKAQEVMLAGRSGRCLPELNILPEFAPCALVTDDRLIIGWNAAVFDLGLAGDDERAATTTHSVELDLRGFAEVDARLAATLAAGEPVMRQVYPWSRVLLHIDPRRGDGQPTELLLQGPSL